MTTETPDNAAIPSDNSDVAQLPYEAARAELIEVVKRLEGAQVPLDQTLALWERGEALVQHCEAFLRAASDRIEAATQQRPQADTDTTE